jgi:hypothetical protein
VKLGQARVDLFRTAATPNDRYSPFSYFGDQLLNRLTKTVSSRFYPARMQITIYSWTIPAHFHLHQIQFVTRLCVNVALEKKNFVIFSHKVLCTTSAEKKIVIFSHEVLGTTSAEKKNCHF